MNKKYGKVLALAGATLLVLLLLGMIFFQKQSEKTSEIQVVVTEAINQCMIKRDEIGYSLKPNIMIQAGDILTTGTESTLTLTSGEEFSLTMKENTSLKMVSTTEGTLLTGSVSVNNSKEKWSLSAGDYQFELKEANVIIAVTKTELFIQVTVGNVQIFKHNKWIQELGPQTSLILKTDGEYEKQEEKQEEISETVTESDVPVTSDESKSLHETQGVADVTSEKGENQAPVVTPIPGNTMMPVRTPVPDNTTVPAQTDNPAVTKEPEQQKKSVTITIKCNTILTRMDELTVGKESYVPDNGIILATTKVELKDSDNVYDVLERVCKNNGIQLKATSSSAYQSIYIEGINHLYEFDCGSGSGWIYRVNGWKPNYGVSKYELEDGDRIELLYTCEYGNDI